MGLGATSMLARVEIRRAWRTLVALGLLAGIALGIALAAAQVARRTATAYDRLVEATGAPDATVLVVGGDRDVPPLEKLPAVQDSWRTSGGVARLDRGPLTYLTIFAGADAPPPGIFTPVYVDGHPPDPASETDLVVSEALARAFDLHVGDDLPVSFLTTKQVTEFDTGFGAPAGPALPLRVVGIVRAVDGDESSQAFSTPALARRLAADASSARYVLVRLRGGADAVTAFRKSAQELATASQPSVGAGEFLGYQVDSPLRQRSVVDVTTRVLVIGLVAFAATTALAGLLACALTLRRYFAASDLSPTVLAALGATTVQLRRARLATTAPFVVCGAFVALTIATAAARLGAVGSTARREPHPGWAPNVALLALGTLAVVVALVGVASLASARRRHASGAARPSAVGARLGRAGAPASVVLGARYGLDPGRGRGALPVRAALAAGVVGVALVVAILVWSTSVGRLVDHPERWGWVADAFVEDVRPTTVRRLADDPRIAAVAVVREADLDVAGRTTTTSAFTDRTGHVGWTITDGRMPERTGEITLGARLASSIDASVGSRVPVYSRAGRRELLDVVGIGSGPDTTNDQFANGAVVARADLERIALTEPFTGAAVVYRPGVDAAQASAAIGRNLEVVRPARPADLDNLDQLGRLPLLLVAVLVLLVVAVLFHMLVTLVRRRRRDFDTLRALGLRPGQLASTVVVTALVFAAVGVGIGAPLGFAIGRFAWRVTQDALFMQSPVASPAALLLGVAAFACVTAVLVAAWPAWSVLHRRDPGRRAQVTFAGRE
jgi:hypothetical protein